MLCLSFFLKKKASSCSKYSHLTKLSNVFRKMGKKRRARCISRKGGGALSFLHYIGLKNICGKDSRKTFCNDVTGSYSLLLLHLDTSLYTKALEILLCFHFFFHFFSFKILKCLLLLLVSGRFAEHLEANKH